ncbi:MAG: GtrA family protein [Patescibacteria group bacterium]
MAFVAIREGITREWKTFMRFALVGGSSFAVKATAYTLLSRVIWNAGPRWVENIIALVISMIFNYTLHRLWTFKFQKSHSGSAPRYVAVVGVASLLDAGLFYIGHDILKFYDLLVLVADAALIAGFTFSAHRLFTFHHNPYRKKADVVQLP